jgi:hypothetical protein
MPAGTKLSARRQARPNFSLLADRAPALAELIMAFVLKGDFLHPGFAKKCESVGLG